MKTKTFSNQEINQKEFLYNLDSILKWNKNFNEIFIVYNDIFNIKDLKNKSFEVIEYYEKYYNKNEIDNIFKTLDWITKLLINSKKAILNDYTLWENLFNFVLLKDKNKIIFNSFEKINDSINNLKQNIKKIKEFNNINYKNITHYLNLIEERYIKLKIFNTILNDFLLEIKGLTNKELLKNFNNLNLSISENLSNLLDVKNKLFSIKKIIENNDKLINSIELKILIKLEPLIISIILSSNKKVINKVNFDLNKEIQEIENEWQIENINSGLIEKNNNIIKEINDIILKIKEIESKK